MDINTVVIAVSAVAAVGAIFIDLIHGRRESRKLLLAFSKDQRDTETLSTERRRLAEVNIGIQHSAKVTPAHRASDGEERSFLVCRLPLHNLGDGPVDILGALTAARVLTSTTPGAGLRGRDLGWLDYESLYWNHPEAGRSFCGISTTKHLNVSDTQFPRLAVGEDMDLLRVDAVNHINAFRSLKSQTLIYRIFLVARGYSLGEILRQLGGRPPDPVRTVRPELLQFQSLAQPNYFRWFYLQKALFIINRFVFRLATDDPDPLGKLSTPDAWRLFLLHHWDFIDEAEAAPRTLPAQYRLPLPATTSKEVADYVKDKWYPQQLLPDDWNTNPAELRRYQEAREYCRDKLSVQIDRWEQLLKRIDTAKDYRPPKVVESSRAKLSPQVPYEWFPQLIRGEQRDEEACQRWLALMQEGYLISAPLARKGHERDRFTEEDIPLDPRVLEPFVMRTHYYLAEVHAT